MTRKEFNFEEMGKQTPFRTPEGFFERMQEEVMKQTVEQQVPRRRTQRRVMAVIWTAAAMFIGVVSYVALHPQAAESNEQTLLVSAEGVSSYADVMDCYVEGLSDEELNEWIEFSENDIFMSFN